MTMRSGERDARFSLEALAELPGRRPRQSVALRESRRRLYLSNRRDALRRVRRSSATRSLPCLFFALFLAWASSTCEAAPRRAEFKLLKAAELPAIGLKINVMSQSREAPLPPPSTYSYTIGDGVRTWKTNLYAPDELWSDSQAAGRWVDEHSNTLTLATITLPLPQPFTKDFPGPHVPRELYNASAAGLRQAQAAWTPEALAQWVADFAGASSAKAQAVAKRPFNLQDLLAFSLEGQPWRFAYVFRLNRASAGQSKAATTWFLALFDLNPGVNMESALASINADFLAKVTSARTSPPAAATPRTPATPSAARKAARSPEFLASRDQVANSIKNMKDWWFVETPNYIILSNMKARRSVMITELQEDVEYLRAAYEQFMPPRKAIKAISVIRIFAESKEYDAYVPPSMTWSSGIWMPDKQELVIRPVEWGGSKDKRAMVLRVTFHEAFHQYIFYAMDEKQAAAWFNEGYANVFGTASLTDRKLSVEEDPYYAKAVEERLAAGPLDLNRFLHLSYEEFYAKDQKTMEHNYALAWGLVYYLRKAAHLEKPPTYAGILDKYGDALWETGDPDKATDGAFADVDLAKFQRDFTKFWDSKNKRSAASRNRIFKDYNPGIRGSP